MLPDPEMIDRDMTGTAMSNLQMPDLEMHIAGSRLTSPSSSRWSSR